MKPESKFWNNKLKARINKGLILGHWERVEVKMPAGFPDCVVCLGKRTLFVELKAVQTEKELKTELRPEQALWNNTWNANGGEAYILAFVETLDQMFWYRDGLAIRKGVFKRVTAPTGVYAAGYHGEVTTRRT